MHVTSAGKSIYYMHQLEHNNTMSDFMVFFMAISVFRMSDAVNDRSTTFPSSSPPPPFLAGLLLLSSLHLHTALWKKKKKRVGMAQVWLKT